MSSLRNAVKRIAHKERSQPVDRQHLGILEKKKDYKQRAVDYHRKEDRIKAMKTKVSMRNPDEFYFGMHNAKVDNGKHKSNEDYRMLSPELVKVMKDQDLSYVRMQKQKDMKKAERLQASLHLLDADDAADSVGAKRTHTVFVESRKDAREFDVAEHFETIPEFAGRAFNRLRKLEIEKISQKRMGVQAAGGGDNNTESSEKQLTTDQLRKLKKNEQKLAKKLAKARSSAYREMESRRERADKMKTAEEHLITEKLVAGKGRKRKIKTGEDGRPAQYKWRRKRLA
jgi:U3 small nucleolar RNA-associated protein 11